MKDIMTNVNETFDDSSIPTTDFDALTQIALDRIEVCKRKNKEYGDSWCKRLGPGAFFTTTRKLDRLEVQAKQRNFDLFDVSEDPEITESLDETLLDAVAYFLLILEKRQAKRKLITEMNTRRERALFHLTAGNEQWKPNAEELKAFVEQFQKTDLDTLAQTSPLIGGLTTRDGQVLHTNPDGRTTTFFTGQHSTTIKGVDGLLQNDGSEPGSTYTNP